MSDFWASHYKRIPLYGKMECVTISSLLKSCRNSPNPPLGRLCKNTVSPSKPLRCGNSSPMIPSGSISSPPPLPIIMGRVFFSIIPRIESPTRRFRFCSIWQTGFRAACPFALHRDRCQPHPHTGLGRNLGAYRPSNPSHDIALWRCVSQWRASYIL